MSSEIFVKIDFQLSAQCLKKNRKMKISHMFERIEISQKFENFLTQRTMRNKLLRFRENRRTFHFSSSKGHKASFYKPF